MSAAMVFFMLGTQERVRNSRGKRAISVRATEVLLYMNSFLNLFPDLGSSGCTGLVLTRNGLGRQYHSR